MRAVSSLNFEGSVSFISFRFLRVLAFLLRSRLVVLSSFLILIFCCLKSGNSEHLLVFSINMAYPLMNKRKVATIPNKENNDQVVTKRDQLVFHYEDNFSMAASALQSRRSQGIAYTGTVKDSGHP